MAESDGIPVLVTGASGFIALHLIKLLQQKNYRVRGTVRSLNNQAKINPIKNVCPTAKYPLELMEADLTTDNGWPEAVKDCVFVFHVASPFPNAPPKNEDELVGPAVDGTKRVLQACVNSGTVKRVVITSSISAVHGETTSDEGKIYSEYDWSNVKSSAIDAYAKSKTLAEKCAWDFVHKLGQDQKIELAVVNPALVMGPTISGVVCTSIELIKRLMDGSMPLIPRIHLSICDVRDVAEAHLKTMITPEAAGHRHLVVSSHLWLRDIAHILLEEFGPQGYFIPTWPAPHFTLWFYSFIDHSTRLILPRVNKTYTYSNRRMKEILKLSPIDVQETLADTAYGLIECGVLKKTKKYKLRHQ